MVVYTQLLRGGKGREEREIKREGERGGREGGRRERGGRERANGCAIDCLH